MLSRMLLKEKENGRIHGIRIVTKSGTLVLIVLDVIELFVASKKLKKD